MYKSLHPGRWTFHSFHILPRGLVKWGWWMEMLEEGGGPYLTTPKKRAHSFGASWSLHQFTSYLQIHPLVIYVKNNENFLKIIQFNGSCKLIKIWTTSPWVDTKTGKFGKFARNTYDKNIFDFFFGKSFFSSSKVSILYRSL